MTRLTLNPLFTHLASDEQITMTQTALNAHNIQTTVVNTGAQKLVGSLEEGLRRIQKHRYVLEDERMRTAVGRGAQLNQILIINGSLQPNRFKLVIVKEQLGF